MDNFDFGGIISLSDIVDTINYGASLDSNNDFIKMCKGIYRFTYCEQSGNKESLEIFLSVLNKIMGSPVRCVKDSTRLKCVLQNIQNKKM